MKTRKQVVVTPRAPYVDSRTPEQKYTDGVLRLRRYLDDLVQVGVDTRAQVVAKINAAGSLAYEVSWGHGVKEDLAAQTAQQVINSMLEVNSPDELLTFLVRTVDYLRNAAGSLSFGSSSAFSNAVAIEKQSVLRSIAERLSMHREFLAEYRAEMEVL